MTVTDATSCKLTWMMRLGNTIIFPEQPLRCKKMFVNGDAKYLNFNEISQSGYGPARDAAC